MISEQRDFLKIPSCFEEGGWTVKWEERGKVEERGTVEEREEGWKRRGRVEERGEGWRRERKYGFLRCNV